MRLKKKKKKDKTKSNKDNEWQFEIKLVEEGVRSQLWSVAQLSQQD